jgi:hypothetical protein
MTVIARTLRSVPSRSATDTWERIVALVAPAAGSPARRELEAVAGLACSCIADETLAHDPLVVYGVGPRLRVYALYGDDAVEGEGANESALSWVPTDGDWRMSLPSLADDLRWVQSKLAKVSTRVTARPVGTAVEGEQDDRGQAPADRVNASAAVDMDAFFRR